MIFFFILFSNFFWLKISRRHTINTSRQDLCTYNDFVHVCMYILKNFGHMSKVFLFFFLILNNIFRDLWLVFGCRWPSRCTFRQLIQLQGIKTELFTNEVCRLIVTAKKRQKKVSKKPKSRDNNLAIIEVMLAKVRLIRGSKELSKSSEKIWLYILKKSVDWL